MANIYSTITYNANLGPAQAQIKSLTGQIAGLTTAFNALDKSAVAAQRSLAGAFAANVGQIGGFTVQTVKAHSAVENFGKQLAANRLTMRQYFREAIAGYTRQNSLMKSLAIQQVRYQQSIAVTTGAGQAMMLTPASISAMGSAAAVAAQKFAIFNKLVDGGATAMLNWGKNTQWAGRQLMVGFTLPLTLLVAVTSKAFRDLDIELTRFQKVYGSDLGGAVDEATLKMRENVKELAIDIARTYGIAAKETAALAADIAATGKEGEEFLGSVQQTTRLAVLGEVDRQKAMKATLAMQSAFQMNTNELAESINYLNAVENQTSATLEDLATAIPKVGPVVRALGGDIQDLSVLLVAMREGGIPAAEAANALKAGLSALINPTQRATEVAKEYGVNLKGIVEANKGQLMPTIFAMQDALNGLGSFARSRVIEQIFGRYQFARITALFDNIGRAGSQTESVLALASKSATELAGIANQEIKTLTESTAVRFNRAIEDVKNSLLPLGQTLSETLIPIFEFIGKGVKAFTSFFESLPGPLKDFTKYGVAITALAGPIIMMVGLFGNLIANGIRFGMMIVRLGARIAGLRVEKFELLNAEVMAAKIGIDNLSSSFISQETALQKLNNALIRYATSLRTLSQTNPTLFIPGAAATGRSTPPIRRQQGSRRPEVVPGTGRGDKIPALLEPGEFVVNRKATQKYRHILGAMNDGSIQGFVEGTPSRDSSPAGRWSRPQSFSEAISRETASSMSQSIRALVRELQATGAISGSISEKQLAAMSQADLAHIRSTYEGAGSSRVKVFEQSNLIVSSGAENNGLNFMFGDKSPNNRKILISSIIDKYGDTPQFRELFGTPTATGSSMKINGRTVPVYDINPSSFIHPSNPQQIQYMSRVLGGFTDSRGAFTLPLSSTTKNAWAPLVAAIFAEKNAAITGTTIRGRAPLFGVPERLSDVRRTGPVGPRPATPTPGMPTRPSGPPGPRPPVMTPRGPIRVSPGEIMIPRTMYADSGAMIDSQGRVGPIKMPTAAEAAAFTKRTQDLGLTGPKSNLAAAQAAAPRGAGLMGLTNATFMASMGISSITAMSGAASDAAIKLNMFVTALMIATSAMQMMGSMPAGSGFLGLKGAGSKLSAAGAGGGRIASLGGGTGGSVLRGLGTAATFMGGPWGIAIMAAAAAGVTGFMLYKKAAEEARQRAVAAFEEPTKSAEYFGITLKDLNQTLEERRFAPFMDLTGIDQGLRDAVKEDYAPLIEKLMNSTTNIGARELSLAFNTMVASGMSSEQAKDTLKAISIEAGTAGGNAYAQAYIDGIINAENPDEAVKALTDSLDPEKNVDLIAELESTLGSLSSASNLAAADDAADRWGMLGKSLLQLGGIDMDRQLDSITDMGGRLEVLGSGLSNLWTSFTGQMFDSTPLAKAADTAANTLDQVKTSIEELGTVSADTYVANAETFMKAWDVAPESALEGMQRLAKWIPDNADNLNILRDKLIELNPAALPYVALIKNTDQAAQALQLTMAGIDLSRVFIKGEDGVIRYNDALADSLILQQTYYQQLEIDNSEKLDKLREDTVKYLNEEIDAVRENIRAKNLAFNSLIKGMKQAQRQAQKDFERDQRRSEKSIEAMNDEIDAIQDNVDARREAFDERMQEYQDEKDAIQDSSDAYIKSLQKNQKAESFYAEQRKTAFSALEKLASGDVFGFLQAREEMSANAQDFSYEKQISNVEERRDLELDAIDTVMEEERRKQEEWEKQQKKRVDAIRDQIDAERDLMAARDKAHEREMRQFDKKIKSLEKQKTQQIRDEKDKIVELKNLRERAQTTEIADYQKLTEDIGVEYEKRTEKRVFELQKEQFYLRYNDLVQRNLANPDVDKRRTDEQLMTAAFQQAFGRLPGARRDIKDVIIGLGMMPYDPNDPMYTPRASGGYISGPGGPKSDVIPAMLSNGEYVIQASSVGKYGKSMMDAINAGKYASGGYVPSADRAETAANNNVYGGTPKKPTSYTGGTYTAPYSPGYTPGWNAADWNLPSQSKGPRGTGRIPKTTDPFEAMRRQISADTLAMYSQNYSHKLSAYAKSDDVQRYLFDKANDTSGGKKWQSLMGLLSSPFGTNARQDLIAAARDMPDPNLNYWRTLSREQKQWFMDLVSGNARSWSREKQFRLMPWLPQEKERTFVERGIPNKLIVPMDRGPVQSLIRYSATGTTTIGGKNYVWDTRTSQYVPLADVGNPLGGTGPLPAPNLPPAPPGPTAYDPYTYDITRPINSSNWRGRYPWWWDVDSTVDLGVNSKPTATSRAPRVYDSPIKFKPNMTPLTTRTTSQEQYPIGISGIYLGGGSDLFSVGPRGVPGASNSGRGFSEKLSPLQRMIIEYLNNESFGRLSILQNEEFNRNSKKIFEEISSERLTGFANGGIVGYKLGGDVGGGGRKPTYFGGTPTSSTGYSKPGPAYSGGTPTSSSGYTSANTQATGGSGYTAQTLNIPNNGRGMITYNGANYSWDTTQNKYVKLADVRTGSAASGFGYIFQDVMSAVNQQGLGSTAWQMLSYIATHPQDLIPFVGSNNIDTSTSRGKDIYAASSLLDILSVIPGMTGIRAGLKGISAAGRGASTVRGSIRSSTARSAGEASSYRVAKNGELLTRTFLTRDKALEWINQEIRNGAWNDDFEILDKSNFPSTELSRDSLLRMSLSMGRGPDGRVLPQPSTISSQKYTRPMFDVVERQVDENLLDSFLGGSIIPSSQGGINPGGMVVGMNGARYYVKVGSPGGTYMEALISQLYRELGLNTPEVSLLNIGSRRRFYAGRSSVTPETRFSLGSTNPDPSPLSIQEFAKLNPFNYFDPGTSITASKVIEALPPDVVKNMRGEMRNILANEAGIGKATDILFGIGDAHDFNYIVRSGQTPTPYRVDFGDNLFYDPVGSPRSSYSINSSSLSIKDYLEGGYGFGSLPSNSVLKNQITSLQQRVQAGGGFKTLIDKAVSNFEQTAPLLRLQNKDFLAEVLETRLSQMYEESRGFRGGEPIGFALGGLIQKFANGGQVGPNGWPYSPSTATGVIPGTSANLTMQKDVLPLFLAFAADYNRLIRTINPAITGGYRQADPSKGNISNHPSGTAMDINWNEEGAHYTRILGGDKAKQQANFDWWSGKKSSLAPWDSKSPIPYKAMNDLLAKYKILQWFGPSSLGGPSWLHWGSTDPMHVQLNQDTDPTLNDVLSVINDLGINPNGTGAERTTTTTDTTTGTDAPTGAEKNKFSAPNRALLGALTGLVTQRNESTDVPSDSPSDAPTDTSDSSTTPSDFTSKFITGAQRVKLLNMIGFKGDNLRTAYGVVEGESGGDREAVNDNGSNKDWGLFQMNDYWNRNILVDGKKADFTPSRIFDAIYNSKLALATLNDPGVISYWKDPWKDWNAYLNETPQYRKGLDDFDRNPQWRSAIGLASGGFISGPGGPRSDVIPAMLSNGEYVVKAASVAKYGKGFMDQLNSGNLDLGISAGGFANGGIIGTTMSPPSFNIPSSPTSNIGVTSNNYGGNSSSSSSNTNVKVVINGAGRKSSKAIANQVISMINSANSRRNHSRSI